MNRLFCWLGWHRNVKKFNVWSFNLAWDHVTKYVCKNCGYTWIEGENHD